MVARTFDRKSREKFHPLSCREKKKKDEVLRISVGRRPIRALRKGGTR